MFEVLLIALSLQSAGKAAIIGPPLPNAESCLEAAEIVRQESARSGLTDASRFVGIVCLPVVKAPEVSSEKEGITG